MREEIEEGKWYHSRFYEEVEVAVAVGHAADFWDLPEEIQAALIARSRVRGVREAYQEKLDKDKRRADEKNRPPAARGMRR